MRGSLRARAKPFDSILALVVLAGMIIAIGPPPAAADPSDPWIEWSVVPDQRPGTVTVNGASWPGAPGPALYQCASYPESGDDFWQMCDQATMLQVLDDPTDVEFPVRDVLQTGESFPPGTVNALGNGTFDCEAQDSGCGILAIEGDPGDLENASRAWANLVDDGDPATPQYFMALYGTPSNPLTSIVTGATTGLKDGDAVTVASSGHRPGTAAMAYLCVDTGPAYPGGCDPVAGSLVTIDGTGGFSEPVELPRFVWDNDPFGNAGWYDCADGCSVAVVSAGNLLSPYSSPITFARTDVEQHPKVLSVTKVLVNKYGAINVTGLVDCGSAMAAWGLDDVAVAGGNISWTARQPIGRKGVVTAHYESAIASICHDPAKAGPYPWGTHPPVTSPDVWWVYPDTGGKFVAGNVTITVRYDGGVWGGWWGAENYLLTGASQWNVKAVSVKK